MYRNSIIFSKIVLITLVFISSYVCTAQQQNTHTNIIMFLVDDLGWQDTSEPFWTQETPLNQKYQTPNMERLADEGMKFTQAYACAVCSPTRVSLMTGMNAAHHRVTNWTLRKNKSNDKRDNVLEFPTWNVNGLQPTDTIENSIYATSLPQILQDNGYFTIHSGKAHFGSISTPGENPSNLGFNINIAGHAAGAPRSYQGLNNYGNDENGEPINTWSIPGLKKYHNQDINLSDAITREAIIAMDSACKIDKPFYLYMAHYAVHTPIQPDNRFVQKYYDLGYDTIEAKYASMVEGMDKSLGDLMDYLEENDLDQNTVILFMSDNGGLSAHARGGKKHTHNLPLNSGKGSAYEGGIREPMIVKWPNTVDTNTVCNDYVIIEDFFPTILEIAGIKDYSTLQTVDGISFVPMLNNTGNTADNRDLFWHYPNKWGGVGPGIGTSSTIRSGDWKLIYFYKDQHFELYNIADDIGEQNNLSEKKPEKTKELAKKLSNYLRKVDAQRPINKHDGQIAPWPDEVNTYQLWYQQPANIWDEALPVGNGRMGAMVFGNVYKERIQFNEESLWAGKRNNTNNPNALNDLPKMRQLIFDGDIKEAYNLGNNSLLSTPPRFRSYQTFGDIFISSDSLENYSEYRRELNLNTGINTTTYKIYGINFIREVFASAPNNIIIVNISADKPGSINTTINLTREKDAIIKAINNQLIMTGQIIDEATKNQGPGGENMKFAAKLIAINDGGEIITEDDNLIIKDANELTLILTAATDYNLDKLNYDRSIDPLSICENILAKAQKRSYYQIRKRHINNHSQLFNRVYLNLGGEQMSSLPTDIRLDSVKNGGEDPALIALYFQYGRYLLMGSSRKPGILPANLQGLWNGHIQAPWNSDYHTNINLQMNYWPAEICNLTETVEPLTNLVNKWQEPGKVTASEMYGCKGWAMHHATDIFGYTAPNADMRWGMSPLSGVWMTFPLWRHFEFTQDTNYLKNQAYPIMKEAMAFVSDFLIEKDGYLVSNPTMSPENAYKLEGKDYPCQLTYAATIDNQTLMAHIDNCVAASELLGVDAELRENWTQIRSKIPPVKIGKDSTIMEWIIDYDEWEPGHRHMSHLLGLYPLSQISPETPALFNAANKTIEKRLKYGGGHTGWSRAWMINFFARLQQPETAYHHVMALMRKSTQSNLFDSHPPFQIDGNFGGTAGIAEMLLQSHNGVINLLPALPKKWSNGSIRGLRARGGFTVDMEWENGILKNISIHSDKNNNTIIKYKDKLVEIETKEGESKNLNSELNL